MQDAATSSMLTKDELSHLPVSRLDHLRSTIEHAVHYLPTQGPISIFVHHNTLHSLEELPFEQAVIDGGKMYECEPYLPEERYRSELHRGRISVDDLRQVLMDDLDEGADELVASFGTRYTLRLAMLQMTLHAVPDAELRWLLAETDMLRRFRDEISPQRREQMIQQTRSWVMRHRNVSSSEEVQSRLPAVVESLLNERHGDKIDSWSDAQWEAFVLNLLWQICHDGVEAANLPSPTEPPPVRIRDLLFDATGEDTDGLVNAVLIRFCGAFLDQGFANWSLPNRDDGFAKAFATLFLHRMTVKPTWMEGMRGELQSIIDGSFDPLVSIANSLDDLGVEESQLDQKVRSTLMALRGWAGMIWQMETSASVVAETGSRRFAR